jgi:hypothetical protein
MECPNCLKAIPSDDATFCLHCGVNVKDKKYSKKDDPADKLGKVEKDVEKIKKYLQEKADEEEGDEEEVPKNGEEQPKKKRTLFGD